MKGLSERDFWTMVDQHEDLFFRCDSAVLSGDQAENDDDDMGYAFLRYAKKLEPETFDEYIIYSWPLIYEEYAGVTLEK